MIGARVEGLIKGAIKEKYGLEVEPGVEPAKLEEYDWESRVAFKLAKELKRNPLQIAEELANSIEDEWFEVEAVRGYVNFRYSKKFREAFIKGNWKIEEKIESGKRVIIEYPSVNPNKPLHIGHLRNALIGDSVSNLMEEVGLEVVRLNYIDDLGLQVAQSLWSYIKNPIDPEEKFDFYIGKEYVKVAKEMAENPELKKEVEGIMRKLEEGNNEIAEVGRKMAEKCVRAQSLTLENYGIEHDGLVWESDIVHAHLLEKAMKELESKGILREGEGKLKGSKVVRLSEHPEFKDLKEGDKVFIRSNGVATYTAKDTAFQMWKFGLIQGLKFKESWKQRSGKIVYTSCEDGEESDRFNNGDIVVNVIGREQEYPQKVIKVVLELAGYKKESENYYHLSYGHARVKEGKFSGRKGTWQGYTADELLEEGQKRAYEIVKERYEEDVAREIAEKVALGAIRYSFLKVSAEKEMVFDWEKSLSFEGDSGPYIQYAYARANRILEKNPIDENWMGEYGLEHPKERALMKRIIEWEVVLEQAYKNRAPNIIANYLVELAGEFNKFYVDCRVSGVEKDVEEGRKRLVRVYLQVMERGMNILGIPVIDRM